MSYKHPYKCNECGFQWRDVKLKEGLVRCVRCGSKNIENVDTNKFFSMKRNGGVLLIICSISSLILGSVLTFVYYEYLSTSTIILWWVIPAGFYVGFFVPIFWWFDDWSFFLVSGIKCGSCCLYRLFQA